MRNLNIAPIQLDLNPENWQPWQRPAISAMTSGLQISYEVEQSYKRGELSAEDRDRLHCECLGLILGIDQQNF